MKKKWLGCQAMIIREHGCQGWNLTSCLDSFDVAFHRYDKKVNPFEVFSLTMLACCSAVAGESGDMKAKK